MNESLAIEKRLIIDNNKNTYMSLQHVYKYLFERYLVSKVNLKRYNDLIKNSELDFGVPHPTQEQLATNLKEYLSFEYIYVINNFFIEKLELNDLDLLKEYLKKGTFEFNSKMQKFVERTYKDVIKNNYHKGEYTDKKYSVCYGAAIPSNFAYNDELVLKILYSKNKIKLADNDFLKNMREKEKFLNEIIMLLKQEVLTRLGISCSVLVEKIYS